MMANQSVDLKLKNKKYERGPARKLHLIHSLCGIEQNKDCLTEALQHLNEVQEILGTILPPHLIEILKNKEIFICEDQFTYFINELKQKHQQEEGNYINSQLSSEINAHRSKTDASYEKADRGHNKKVESYKKSRLNEKIKKIRKKLREQFITEKVKKTKEVLKRICELKSYCERKLCSFTVNQKNQCSDSCSNGPKKNQKIPTSWNSSSISRNLDNLHRTQSHWNRENFPNTDNIQINSRVLETNTFCDYRQQFTIPDEPVDLRVP